MEGARPHLAHSLLRRDLAQAMEHDELRLESQPLVRTRGRRVARVEALAR